MPEFYSKSFEYTRGFTYAIGGGGTGFTTSYFTNGASLLDGINALMVKGPGGATLTMILLGSTLPISGLNIVSGTIYPFKPKMLYATGPNNIIGLV